MADPTFNAYTISSKDSWRTPDFNPNYKRDSTREYNKALDESFKAFGVYAKKNVNEYLDKLSTPEGMLEETIGGSSLTGVGGILGTMIGKNAKTFNTADALRAEELKAQGANAREIWEKTQNRIWNTGIRQEIDDSVMQINPSPKFSMDKNKNLSTSLGNFIDHPELFKAYPELKYSRVRVDPTYKDGEAAFYSGQNTIVIGLDKAGNPDTTSLLHEIQHAVQNKEGWQSGGNPDQFGGRLIVLPDGTMKKVDNFTEYETLAGEWEARQTQLRAKLSAENRAKIFPDDTSSRFDYPSGALNVHNPDNVLAKMKPKKK